MIVEGAICSKLACLDARLEGKFEEGVLSRFRRQTSRNGSVLTDKGWIGQAQGDARIFVRVDPVGDAGTS
jgi:hypothetical protein